MKMARTTRSPRSTVNKEDSFLLERLLETNHARDFNSWQTILQKLFIKIVYANSLWYNVKKRYMLISN